MITSTIHVLILARLFSTDGFQSGVSGAAIDVGPDP